jgi:D-3-phosphoglycerate dehydrogenase
MPDTSDDLRAQPTVLIWDPLFYLDWEYDIEDERLAARGVRLIVAQTREEGDARLPDADVVIVHDGPFGGAEMDRLRPGLAGLICYSVGMNQIVAADAAARGLLVRNLPNWASEGVSDHTIAMLLAAHRRIVEWDRGSHGTDWEVRRFVTKMGIRGFRGQTLGVIGAGRIGKLVARKARGVGYRTIANDPFIETTGDPDLPLLPLADVLAQSDAIAMCCSLNETSQHLLDAAAFARMKPGMTLVNCARGGLIDEDALYAALQDGTVAVAALDVRDGQEPPDPATDRLAPLPNTVLTPHVAFYSAEGFIRYHEECAEVVLELLEASGRLLAGPTATTAGAAST